MYIKEIMTRDVITISPDASLKEVGELFKTKRISGTPVVDCEGNIVGIITLTDLLRILDQIYGWKEMEKKDAGLKCSKIYEEEKKEAKVKNIMTKHVLTIAEDETIDEVMKLMFERGVHSLPVVKDGRLVGIVGKRDLVNACF